MPSTFTQDLKTQTYTGKISVQTGLFINGKFVDPVEKGTIDVVDPTNGKTFTTVGRGTKKDLELAVDAAEHAFKTTWGMKTSGTERGRLMYRLVELMEKHIDELSAIESIDAGKQFMAAKMFDITMAINNMRYFAGWADKSQGKTIETDESKFAYTRNEPIGVCGCIVPWNFPLMITSWKLGPALATGNTVILKPSEITPLSALKFAELTAEAGFPPGVINVLPGYGSEVGQAMSEHLRIRKVSFTGSTLVGRKIMEAAAKSNLKRVTLELGGKSPVLVFDDADLDQAVKWTAMNVFNHSGQMCTAGTRVFVQEGIYDKFVKAFAEASKASKAGDLFDPQTTHSPVVSQTQLNRVLGYISSGKEAGAKIITGGERLGDKGYFIQPTIFTNINRDMKIVQEEIFGPVAVVTKFKDEAEVIELGNDTTYGLGANIFTQNLARATRLSHAIDSGSVWVNMGSWPDYRIPFGGVKQSGQGKEMGEAALEAFTNIKAVHVNIGIQL